MKKVLMICGLVAAAFGASVVNAATAIGNFDVTATVNSTCLADNGTGTPTIAFGAIDSFGTTAIANKTADLKFKCTRGLPITSVTLSTTASTVAGLAYGLSVGTGVKVDGAAATGGTGATADTYTYTVTGTMASGQAGDKNAATTDSQTLTIGF